MRPSAQLLRRKKVQPVSIDEGRPLFGPLQIRCQSQLYKGRMINICGPGGYRLEVVLTRDPYRDNGVLKIEYEYTVHHETKIGSLDLETHSVIRNKELKWDLKHWLERT